MRQNHRDEPTLPLDTEHPSVARMYDYYLGGKDNFEVDRDAADKVARAIPEVRDLALKNRAFLRLAVQHMASHGIHQFIDIGSGLPTQDNTHQVAQETHEDARCVYVDHDPVVLAYGRALLADNPNTKIATADMRRPADVLGHSETVKLINFDEPVGVLMLGMINFMSDDEAPGVVAVQLSSLRRLCRSVS